LPTLIKLNKAAQYDVKNWISDGWMYRFRYIFRIKWAYAETSPMEK